MYLMAYSRVKNGKSGNFLPLLRLSGQSRKLTTRQFLPGHFIAHINRFCQLSSDKLTSRQGWQRQGQHILGGRGIKCPDLLARSAIVATARHRFANLCRPPSTEPHCQAQTSAMSATAVSPPFPRRPAASEQNQVAH